MVQLQRNGSLKRRFCPTVCGNMFALLGGACHAVAQGVLSTAPQVSPVPEVVQQAPPDEMNVFDPRRVLPGMSESGQPLRWGPVNLRPHALYRFSYGNGILSMPGQPQTTAINEISPGMLFELGPHWALDYTPTLRYYTSSQFRDTLDHAVVLTGATSYKDWSFGLSQGASLSSTPLVETGTQTDQENYSTALTASYAFNNPLSVDLSFSSTLRSADQFNSSKDCSSLDWVNYRFAPRLSIGLGVGGGFVDVDSGSDMTYEQLQGRIDWRATDKISLRVHGGGEDRQFLDSSANNEINPVFGATLQYQPFEATTLSIDASRGTSASYFTDEITESTGVTASLNQRLLGKLYLTVGGGYSTVHYVASDSVAAGGRDDDEYSLSVRLSCLVLRRGTVAAFYQYSDNSSSHSGFSYSSSQVGFELGYRF